MVAVRLSETSLNSTGLHGVTSQNLYSSLIIRDHISHTKTSKRGGPRAWELRGKLTIPQGRNSQYVMGSNTGPKMWADKVILQFLYSNFILGKKMCSNNQRLLKADIRNMIRPYLCHGGVYGDRN
jgi:hypothetical protein